jgi:hypothetical protein
MRLVVQYHATQGEAMWLKIQREGDSAVTLAWGNSEGPYPFTYQIGQELLRDVAERLHGLLEQIADWAKLRDQTRLPTLLYDLANAGADLYLLIFDCPQKASDIAALKQWIDDQWVSGDKTLVITADPTFHVPWGLTFEGDPRTVRNCGGVIADYNSFWSLKYTLSLVFSAHDRPVKSRQARGECRLLSLINPIVLAEVEKDFEEEPDRFNEFQRLLKTPVGPAYNLQTCDLLIEQAARKDTLFHFFGHGKDGALDLGHEKIDVIKFKRMMEKLLDRRNERSSRSYNLIFLNACDTAIGRLDASFRSAASQPGLCGFIATEAPIPREFAVRYGYRFLKSMVVDGRSIGSTMDELLRDPDL